MRQFLAAVVLLLIPVSIEAQSSKTLTLEGVKQYNSAEILSFAAQVAAQRDGAVRPARVAEIIEAMYLEDGYFLASTWVGPDGGTIYVDEGEIGSVQIEGVDAATFELVKGLVAPVLGVRGVTQDDFERAIMLVEDIGAISAVAEIDYHDDADLANLRIIAAPQDRSYGSATLDHPATAFGEAATISFSQQYRSFLTPGDLARAELSLNSTFDGDETDGFAALSYRTPVGTSGAYADFYAANALVARDATGTLAKTDITGQTIIASLGYPAIRLVDRFGYVLIELRHSESEVTVGPDEFRNSVNVISASWIDSHALENGGAVEYGINVAYGQTATAANTGDGDDEFTHLRFGIGYDAPVSALGDGTTLRAELYGQYSADDVPSIDHFLLGGKDSERGYGAGEAGGDSGLSASLEIGRDYLMQGDTVRLARPFAFLDAGYVQSNETGTSDAVDLQLASVGLGIDLVFVEGFGASAYAAMPLRDGTITEKRDTAIYMSLTKEW